MPAIGLGGLGPPASGGIGIGLGAGFGGGKDGGGGGGGGRNTGRDGGVGGIRGLAFSASPNLTRGGFGCSAGGGVDGGGGGKAGLGWVSVFTGSPEGVFPFKIASISPCIVLMEELTLGIEGVCPGLAGGV